MVRGLLSASARVRTLFCASTLTVLVLALAIVGSPGSALAQVPSTRIINTVAGTGTQGFSGDGGPATAGAWSTTRTSSRR